MSESLDLKSFIRDVPDFPKPGIIFKDITTLLKDGKQFQVAVNAIVEHFKPKEVEVVAAIDSRGFIFGGAVAHLLGAGFVPIRKKGKLPHKIHQASYELEYGTDTLEIHQDAFKPNQRILLVDDLLATGGTAQASLQLIQKLKGQVVGVVFLIELAFLKGRKRLEADGVDIFSLISYDNE